jgi:hypothetical protein
MSQSREERRARLMDATIDPDPIERKAHVDRIMRELDRAESRGIRRFAARMRIRFGEGRRRTEV